MKESTSKFWEETHQKTKKLKKIWEEFIPNIGWTVHEETNIFLAINRIVYDAYNNGWGCNNRSPELDYLHQRGYFKDVSVEDLIAGSYEQFGDYFDSQIEKIIEIILDCKKNNSFTKAEDEDIYENYGLSESEWNDKYDEYYGYGKYDDEWEDEDEDEEY